MSNDYLMKHIQLTSLGLAQVFNLEEVVHEITDPYHNKQTNELYKVLMDMLVDGKINAAEDLLFAAVENEDVEKEDVFNLAFDFYLKVNDYNDDYLQLCNFSRAEANEGWADITRLCKMK